MEPIGVFSGIASGIDFRGLVDQIMALERRPIDRLQARIDDIEKKRTVFQDFRTLLDDLRTTAGTLSDGTAFDATSVSVSGLASNGSPLFSATADPATVPGSYQLEVLSLATAAKLGGDQFSDPNAALALAGDFVVNGRVVTVNANDTLTSIRDRINVANTGANATGVSASIISTGGFHRLVLTADQPGAAGIGLADTSASVLAQLGFVDGTTQIAQPNTSGANSRTFASDTAPIAAQLGLTTAGGPQTVTIGGQAAVIDLDTQSLTDIASTLSGLSGVNATVQSTVRSDGTTVYSLDIRGTTSFVDAGNTLELLGVLEQGRAAVAQEVTSANTFQVSGGAPATTATTLQSLFQNGQSAGVAAGDTFTVAGTRGDGSAVSFTYTVGAADTVADFLAALNDATTGFGAGTQPATATIDATGAIVLTDSVGGDSQLALSIVSHNEGGGTVDLGVFGQSTVGRAREITAGADAILRVDGITMTRGSNVIADAIAGVTLTLQAADPGRVGAVTVARGPDTASDAIQEFVDKYNELVAFIKEQLLVEEGKDPAPLRGDSTLRTTRSSIVNILLNGIPGGASGLPTAATAGITLNSDGTLKFDATTFQQVYSTRYSELRQLFMETGTTTDPDLQFISSAGTATAGTYAVDITTAASQAAVTGSGFSGTYADDGTADVITVTDVVTGSAISTQLVNGMTTADIVDALNTSFQSGTKQQLVTGNTLYSDPTATTPVTTATTFSSLYDAAGTGAGVVAGDTISYSGVRPDGTSFTGSFTVDDPLARTVGELTTAMQGTIGTDATVSVVNGTIVVEDINGGSSPLALSLTANNEGGGTLDFGTVNTAVQGRSSVGLTASANGNDVVITHDTYGSTFGFSVALTGGGADNTGQLGIATGSFNGVDVAGTIGGHTATGSGQQLVGDSGTPVSGLHVSYTGTVARAAGDVSLTLGIGASLERLFDGMFEIGTGVLDTRNTAYDDRVNRLTLSIDRGESRLSRREAFLIKKFTTMETIVGQLQAQSASLTNQIQSMFAQKG